MSDRCPHCSDYDDIKEELENTRKDAERETKGSLTKCESEKKKLQKQLLGVGTAVVVAGTILGQEFIDKVGSYIESFNSVKNATTGIVSQADTPSISVPIKSDDSNTENKEPKKKETKSITPGYGGTLVSNVALSPPYTSPFEYDNFYPSSGDYLSMNLSSVLDIPEMNNSFKFDLDRTLFNEDPFQLNNRFFFDSRSEIYDNSVLKASTPVPGPGVLMVFVLGIILLKKPRNRI